MVKGNKTNFKKDGNNKKSTGNVASHKKYGTIPKGSLSKTSENSTHIKFSNDNESKVKKEAKDKGKTVNENSKIETKNNKNKNKKIEEDKKKNLFSNVKPKNISEKDTKAKSRKPKESEEEAILLQEITSLGGTKEDFEWLNDVDTEDEEIEEKARKEEKADDLKLKDQLSKFIKGLGISKIRIEDEDEEDENGLSKIDIESKWEDIIEGDESEDEELKEAESEEEDTEEVEDVEEEKEESKDLNIELGEAEINEYDEFNTETRLENQEQERTFATKKLKMDQRLKKPLKKKVLDETSLWYEIPLEDLKEGSNFDRDFANELLETAKDLIQQENELSENGNKSQSDQQFMADIMQSGTLSDKISALTLQIQESPLHHLKEFSKLLMMMRRNNRRESMLCLNSLKDLCLSCLLPSDRKLKYFFDQPLSSPNVTQKHLIIWYFEDYLKKAYFDFLLISEQRGHDPLLHSKQSMLNYFYELLSQKPEQESNLLTLIVNKLGDKENKIASKASYLLLQVLENHPGMKQIVATEIENILFRSNISLRAQYYSVITLNQFSLSRDDAELSNSLMETYFTLFKKILAIKEERPNKKKTKKDRKKDKNSNNKGKLQIKESTASSEDSEKIGLIAGILTGVNRAFPFSKIDPVSLKEHINTIFYIAKSFNFNAAIQALNFLNQISTQQPIYRDRYMKALYETLFDHRLIYSSKQAMYLNLLYKSLKQDTSIARVMSFVKRMFQVSMWHQPPFVNGLIYLTYKLSSIHKVINASIEQAEDTFEHNQSSEPKEDTKDIKDEVRDLGESNEETKGKVEATVPEVKEGNKTINSALYQGRYDDPKKSYAEYTCLWELGLLMNHFHPSVNHHINQLLKLEEIKEQPLLHLHTLQHFLDIFAYRNPKKVSEENSYNSFMKGSAFKAVNGVIWDKQSGISSAEVVNSEEFWKKSDSEVQAEHQFFHKYFKLTKSNNAEKKKAKDKEMSDSEDEDEDEIWKAMKGSTNIDEMEDDADMDEDVDLGDMDFSEDGMDDEDEDEDEDEDIQDFIENGEALNSHDDDDNDNDNELANTKDAISFDDILLNGDDDSDDNVSDPQDSGEDSESGDIDFDMGESSEEELGEETITNKKKSKETNKRKLNEPTKVGPNNERNVKKREQRKKLKSLPMFASAEDYDHLLEEE